MHVESDKVPELADKLVQAYQSKISIPPGLRDSVIAFLNEWVTNDPHAVTALIASRVSCNQWTAQHPTIQVLATTHDAESAECMVGVLGLLNGIFSCATEDAYITAVFNEQGSCQFAVRTARGE